MESNQVYVAAPTVFCNLQEVLHIRKPRLSRQVVSDVLQSNWHNRIHDDLPIIHAVAATHFDVRSRPDADGASDPTASYAITQAFGEHHVDGAISDSLLCSGLTRTATARRASPTHPYSATSVRLAALA